MTTKPPLSLRMPEATQVRVAKWATEQGIPKNAAYVQLVERGLRSLGPHLGLNERAAKPKPAKVTNEPSPKAPAVHVDVPVFERKAFNPQQKPTKGKK